MNESTSQIATTNWALHAEIQVVDEVSNIKVLEANPIPPKIPECYIFESIDLKVPNSLILHEFKDPFEVHCSIYKRELELNQKLKLCVLNSIPFRWPRYGGRDNGKK